MAENLLDAVSEQPVGRDERGKFGANNSGKPKGSLNRVSRELRAKLAEALRNGDIRDPLLILGEIASDTNTDVSVRVRAASELARFVHPDRAIQRDQAAGDSESADELLAETKKVTELLKNYYASVRPETVTATSPTGDSASNTAR